MSSTVRLFMVLIGVGMLKNNGEYALGMDSGGNSLICAAAVSNKPEVVAKLIAAKDIDSSEAIHALHIAAGRGFERVVEVLSSRIGLDTRWRHGYTPLHQAVIGRCFYIVRLLLAQNIDVNAVTDDGNSALHMAAYTRSADMVAQLLQAHSKQALMNNQGETALHVAARFGAVRVVEQLVNAGSDVNGLTLAGSSPASLAIAQGHLDIMHVLMCHARFDKTKLADLFFDAARSGNQRAVDWFLDEAHIDVNIRNKAGYTALMLACYYGHERVVSALLSHHADLLLRSYTGNLAVHIAFDRERYSVVRTLLKHTSVLVKIPDIHGETLLHKAIRKGYFIRYLLQSGASMYQKNCTGKTPFELALTVPGTPNPEIMCELKRAMLRSEVVTLSLGLHDRVGLHSPVSLINQDIIRLIAECRMGMS